MDSLVRNTLSSPISTDFEEYSTPLEQEASKTVLSEPLQTIPAKSPLQRNSNLHLTQKKYIDHEVKVC